MLHVLWITCSVLCALLYVFGIMYSVLRVGRDMLCVMDYVRCAMCDALWVLCYVLCIVYCVLCIM